MSDEKKKNRFKGMLVEYVKKNRGGYRNKKGKTIIQPIKVKKGMMVAVPVDGKVRIGWSLCNFKMGDVFGPLGETIAIEKAISGSTVAAASSMVKPLEKFIGRARKYYKDQEVEVTFPKSVYYSKDESVEVITSF